VGGWVGGKRKEGKMDGRILNPREYAQKIWDQSINSTSKANRPAKIGITKSHVPSFSDGRGAGVGFGPPPIHTYKSYVCNTNDYYIHYKYSVYGNQKIYVNALWYTLFFVAITQIKI
jgi:hypothetical protein